jgi:hypothetical protein
MPAAFNTLANFVPQGWVLKSWRMAIGGQPRAICSCHLPWWL